MKVRGGSLVLLGGLLALLQRPDAPRPAQAIRPTAFERSI